MAKRAFIGNMVPFTDNVNTTLSFQNIYVLDNGDNKIPYNGTDYFYTSVIPTQYSSTATSIKAAVETDVKTVYGDATIEMIWLNDFSLTTQPIVNNPTRALNSAFTVHATRMAFCMYTIELSVSFALLSAQECTVDLLSDASNPPTTSQGTAKLYGSQLVGLGVTLTNKTRHQLTCFVQRGHYVKLVTSGGGTATLINSIEVII